MLPVDESAIESCFKIWKLYGVYPQVADQEVYHHLHLEFVRTVEAEMMWN